MEILAVEVAADAREQVRLVLDVDGHLQAFADRRQAALDDRLVAVEAVVQRARLPGDVGGVVAQEVGHVELLPQRFVGVGRQAVQAQRGQRLVLAVLQFAVGRMRLAAQHAQGHAVQVFEQLGLPGVPHLGAGAADVGHRQQVQRGQVAFVLDQAAKAGDHVGSDRSCFCATCDIVRWCSTRNTTSSVSSEPRRGLRRTGRRPRCPAWNGRRRGPWRCRGTARPRTAARLAEVGDQLAAERVFVRVLGHREAAHVTHHHHDVLVHRVDVEQVVLHLADDAAEVRQVAPEDAGVVHAAQRVHQARPAPAGCAGTGRG
jgi:hypothetical protein